MMETEEGHNSVAKFNSDWKENEKRWAPPFASLVLVRPGWLSGPTRRSRGFPGEAEWPGFGFIHGRHRHEGRGGGRTFKAEETENANMDIVFGALIG